MIIRTLLLVCVLLSHNISIAQNTVSLNLTFAIDFSDSCSVAIDDNYLGNPRKISTHIEDGKANITFDIAVPQVVSFNYNNQSIDFFAEPGENMSIHIGTDSLSKSTTIEGDGVANFDLHGKFFSKFQKCYNSDMIKDFIMNTQVDSYEIELYKQRTEQQDFIGKYEQNKDLTASYRKYLDTETKYNYLYRLQAFPIVYGNNTKTLEVTPLPSIMTQNINDNLAQNDSALPNKSYREFVYYYVVYQTSKLNNFAKFTDLSTSMERKCAFAFAHLKGETLNWYVAKFLNDECLKVSPPVVKAVFKKLEQQFPHTAYTNAVRSKCEIRGNEKEEVAKSAKSSANSTPSQTTGTGPKIKDMDGNFFTLSDFKGKVVYIDFWASWCGPCRQQFPYSKNLHGKFSKKQLKKLEFLYISIDGKEDSWLKAIEQMKLNEQGKMGIVPGDWNSEICRYFQINSIPRYMIMNKNGEIVDFNAKRPSDENVYMELIKLLSE